MMSNAVRRLEPEIFVTDNTRIVQYTAELAKGEQLKIVYKERRDTTDVMKNDYFQAVHMVYPDGLYHGVNRNLWTRETFETVMFQKPGDPVPYSFDAAYRRDGRYQRKNLKKKHEQIKKLGDNWDDINGFLAFSTRHDVKNRVTHRTHLANQTTLDAHINDKIFMGRYAEKDITKLAVLKDGTVVCNRFASQTETHSHREELKLVF